MKNEKILPFANETKKLKHDFKKTIDEMDDDDFLQFMFFIMSSGYDDDFDEDLFDEDFDEDFYDDYENPFSGEMVNFKCPNCKKISAYPIEIINEIYDATKKEPLVECYHCDSVKASPIYYKAPNGKIFEH